MAPTGRRLWSEHLPPGEDGWQQQAGLGEAKATVFREEEGWVPHAGIEPRTIAGREFPEEKSRIPLPNTLPGQGPAGQQSSRSALAPGKAQQSS